MEADSPILYPQGLLWKIEKAGHDHSYLYGTMHVADPRVTQLANTVEAAFAESQHFVMEMVLNFKAVGYVTSASFFNDGKTLKAIMKPEQYKRLTDLINHRLMISEQSLNHMKPWAVLMMLMMPIEQQLETKAALDMLLLRRASLDGKKVSGLETPEEQVAVFESMSLEDQVWMLNRAVDEVDKNDELFSVMTEAYIKGDLAGLVRQQQQQMVEGTDIDDRFMAQLLDKRNQRMAQRLVPILEQGKAFIAIGALHLPGQGGVLDLLAQQGYSVSPLK